MMHELYQVRIERYISVIDIILSQEDSVMSYAVILISDGLATVPADQLTLFIDSLHLDDL
jgi:hypothetical protein